jgi:hypothetical protein
MPLAVFGKERLKLSEFLTNSTTLLHRRTDRYARESLHDDAQEAPPLQRVEEPDMG